LASAPSSNSYQGKFERALFHVVPHLGNSWVVDSARRNVEAHQRRGESVQLGEALDEVVVQLEVLLRALSRSLDNPPVIAKSLRWDSLENAGSLRYQRLAAEPVPQT